MFKKIFFGGITAGILWSNGYAFGLNQNQGSAKLQRGKVSQSAQKRAVKYADFSEFWLIISPFMVSRGPGEKDETILLKRIRKLEEFAKRKPHSFLVDDAKLGMAKIYKTLQKMKEKKDGQDISAELDGNWQFKANEQLIDLTENHKDSLYFDVIKGTETKEPTAAIALYNLGVWNNNLYFLEVLVREYPDSETSREVKSKLKGRPLIKMEKKKS